MAACEIRTKALERYKSKENIKYKSQTPVSSSRFCTSIL